MPKRFCFFLLFLFSFFSEKNAGESSFGTNQFLVESILAYLKLFRGCKRDDLKWSLGEREREREGISVRGIEKDKTSEDNWRLEKEMINRLRGEETVAQME